MSAGVHRRAAETGESPETPLSVEDTGGQRPAAVVAEVQALLQRNAGEGFSTSSSADVVRADRDSG
ncbi:hypothetical protein SAMN04488107_2971 [Geodermatophilus saharensis]|uniref:Uncharacterized protein n=1 Tax=Geodermatophilus saharensis TaxID=1137994 RepID=A0A239FDP6_9ACTN|nr:hypothetical protein [Geodermatophilus saharensis]SNS54957.1 hypothetical protein SAMN04488107_2971 [Geodermatophilus saharensis]